MIGAPSDVVHRTAPLATSCATSVPSACETQTRSPVTTGLARKPACAAR